MCSMSSSRRSSSTPITSAIASRVTSSGVGPSPPHTMTASARSSSSRRHCTMRPRLSPTLRCSQRVDADGRRAARRSTELLVSTIWPSSNSVPIARTSHRMVGALRPLDARAAETMSTPETTDSATANHSTRVVERGPRHTWAEEHDADREELEERLPLAERDGPAARCRASRRTTGTPRCPTSRAATMTTAIHEKSPVDPEGDEAPEHQELVGQRVEERARARGAVAAPASRRGRRWSAEHEPQRDGEPRRALVDDQQQRRDGQDQAGARSRSWPASRSLVAEAADRGRPRTPASARPATSGVADRLGDVAPHERRTGRAQSASRCTTPSISGASRCVRPTSVPSSSLPSTSTSISAPTSASRAAA